MQAKKYRRNYFITLNSYLPSSSCQCSSESICGCRPFRALPARSSSNRAQMAFKRRTATSATRRINFVAKSEIPLAVLSQSCAVEENSLDGLNGAGVKAPGIRLEQPGPVDIGGHGPGHSPLHLPLLSNEPGSTTLHFLRFPCLFLRCGVMGDKGLANKGMASSAAVAGTLWRDKSVVALRRDRPLPSPPCAWH